MCTDPPSGSHLGSEGRYASFPNDLACFYSRARCERDLDWRSPTCVGGTFEVANMCWRYVFRSPTCVGGTFSGRQDELATRFQVANICWKDVLRSPACVGDMF